MKYRIKEDLILLRNFFQQTQEEFARGIVIDRVTLARTENGQSYPRTELMEKIYGSAFQKGLMLNLQKEMFYKDDIRKNHILLSHASKKGIKGNLSLSKGKKTMISARDSIVVTPMRNLFPLSVDSPNRVSIFLISILLA